MTDTEGNLTESKGISRKHVWVILGAILILAGVLRVVEFGKAPPGLNQDEAVNVWNAYCLLKTGKDQVGVSWPIFYMRGVGGNWSPLYIYLLIPFQAIGGMNIITTRMPPVLFGLTAIALIYYVGKRLFDEKVGLLAAMLLTVNPWHFQSCRWGHESSIAALLGLAPLALMLWSNIIPTNGRQARPIAAALAGIVTGICCYGYQPVRVFVPVFLFLTFLFMLPELRQSMKKPKYLFAVILFVVGFAVIFGPLAWQHIFHPEGINRHFQFQSGRFGSVGLYESLKNTFIRYAQHFRPNFLFAPMDRISPPDAGLLQWYMLPLLAAGIITIIIKFRKSAAVRIVLAFVLAYPVGDSLAWGGQVSAFRSFAGLSGIILTAAIGTVYGIGWLWKRKKAAGRCVTGVLAIVIVISNIHYFRSFFRFVSNDTYLYQAIFHGDIVEACEWLKPRFDDFDVIIFTQSNMANIVAAVTLDYDPNRWLSEPHEFVTIEEWDYYIRCGKMYFSLYPSTLQFMGEVLSGGQYRPGHVLIIIRPGEVQLMDPEKQILHKVIRPDGVEALWICVI